MQGEKTDDKNQRHEGKGRGGKKSKGARKEKWAREATAAAKQTPRQAVSQRKVRAAAGGSKGGF